MRVTHDAEDTAITTSIRTAALESEDQAWLARPTQAITLTTDDEIGEVIVLAN